MISNSVGASKLRRPLPMSAYSFYIQDFFPQASPTSENAANVDANAFLKQCSITAGSTVSHGKRGIHIASISATLNGWVVANAANH